MADSMAEFGLGIIGGCMSHQRDTPLNALYHRQLGAMLHHDPGVRLRVRIARGFALDPVSRLDRLLSEPGIDGVMVHIREVAITSATRALVTESLDGRRRLRLNPAMLHRSHRPIAEGRPSAGLAANADGRDRDAYADTDDDRQDQPLPGVRIAGFRVRNLNYLLGELSGLGDWAIDEELLRFDELASTCRQRAVPLFVLGPTPATYSLWASRVMRRANERLGRHLADLGVPHALLDQTRDDAGRPLVRADGIHMTIAGHGFIAKRLVEQGIGNWIATILAGRGAAGPRGTRPSALVETTANRDLISQVVRHR